MANRIIKHYYECEAVPVYSQKEFKEIDKSKSISDLSRQDLQNLINRLRMEREAESLIRDLKRSSGEIDNYENPAKVDTQTPVNQLYHHGILGMKWGIRRFQKPDGTRTPEGKRRDAEKDYEDSEDYKMSRSNKKKAPSGLSNEELKKLNERLQLENTYRNLTAEKIEKSESFVKTALKNAGQAALTEFSKNVFLGTAKILVTNIAPTFADTMYKKN